LLGKRWHLSVLDVRSCRGTDCDTDLYLVYAEFSERLAVNKLESHKSDVERYNLDKRNELEVRKQYRIKISNRFVALEGGQK
jgi:IS1 family transposase